MVYTVTLNPAIDCSMKVDDYKEGTVNRTQNENISAGGKGINVSTVLAQLDVETTALGFCGGYTGKMLTDMLTDMNITHDFVEIDGLTRINVKLKVEGKETEINGIGANIDEKSYSILCDKLSKIKEDDFLVLAGSVPKSLSENIYSDIIKRVKSRKIVVDTSGKALLDTLENRPFLVKPNNFELGEIFSVEISSKDLAIKYAQKLQTMGALNVLVSMAGEGAVLVCENGEIYQCNSPKGTVKNSVGAGDSMVAGFIAGFMQSQSYEKAFKMGVSCGSATAFSEFLAKKSEIFEIYKHVNVVFNKDFVQNNLVYNQ